MRVVFEGEFQKGSRCRVRLGLQDGAHVESNEFQP
jgi:hypothetical protein